MPRKKQHQNKKQSKPKKHKNQNPTQNNQPKTNDKPEMAGWSAGQFATSVTERKVIALYHPWYHPRDWNGGQTRQNKAGKTTQKPPFMNSVSRGNNTTLSRNQGSPQPGAPKSPSVSRTGNRSHRIGAIQKLAMAMPGSKWEGDTKRKVKQSVKQSYGEKVTDAYLPRLSGSSQLPLRCPFPSIIIIIG